MLSRADDVEDSFCLLEDCVHLLEGAVGGLGIEEVDAWDDECVYHGEDYVGLIADCGEGYGCYHYYHLMGIVLDRLECGRLRGEMTYEVECPVGRCG